MGLWMQTTWARRRVRRKNGRQKRHTVLWLMVLAGILVWSVTAIRPKLTEYAENYVQYQTTAIMEQAVADCIGDIDEIGHTQTNETGAVTSLSTDTAAINRMRTQIVQRVYKEIGELESAHASVALGTLIDPQYLAGIGPQIPFGVVALGQVTAKTDSGFSAEGINQTIYEVTIRVNANFSLHALGYAKNITISAEYPLEETIIVGEVPMIAASSE
ncbi:MAG: sporulation protein YunB [Eubacteriales bacterium]|nr:sporulation protein YunB [Eubacteriales bacterium]